MVGLLTFNIHAVKLTQQKCPTQAVYRGPIHMCVHGVQGPSAVGKPTGSGMGSCSFSIDQTFPSQAAFEACGENPLHALLYEHALINLMLGSTLGLRRVSISFVSVACCCAATSSDGHMYVYVVRSIGNHRSPMLMWRGICMHTPCHCCVHCPCIIVHQYESHGWSSGV